MAVFTACAKCGRPYPWPDNPRVETEETEDGLRVTATLLVCPCSADEIRQPPSGPDTASTSM